MEHQTRLAVRSVDVPSHGNPWAALTFMTGAAANALIRYKDVTVDPKKRNSKLQYWGEEEAYHSSLEKLISWNAYGKEGLGVDHEKWLKEKEAQMKSSK